MKHILLLFIIFLLSGIFPCFTLAKTNAPSPANLLWKEAHGALDAGSYIKGSSAFGRIGVKSQYSTFA